MLSAKKVKLHGISDSRWTVNDKLSQYKGIISLCSRDNKLLQNELSKTKKEKARQIQQLSRDILTSRKELENAIGGDKQRLRNSLQENKDLLLAFQNLQPEKVVENVHQTNFTKRKELDRLKFQMKLKKDKLISRKLNLARLEDREIFADLYGKLHSDEQAQVITGKVQDAILKQEAAITIRYIYKRILDLLKSDTYYYDAVLNVLGVDLRKQTGCLHRITILGQLATENLDDRRDELKVVESTVKLQKGEMIRSIDIIKSQVTDVANNVKALIRRDSDINIRTKGLIKTQSDEVLLNDVSQFEQILVQLQKIIMVPNYETIYPCLVTQRNHEEELNVLVKTMQEGNDRLISKKIHAEIKSSSLYYSMVDTTLQYMTKKAELHELIKMKIVERVEISDKIKSRGKLAIQIRASLQQISDVLALIQTEAEKRINLDGPVIIKESNELKLIPEINAKLRTLMTISPSQAVGKARENAQICYMDMIAKTRMIPMPEEIQVDDEFESVTIEDANILTRADIKKQSQEIIEHTLALEQEMFMAQPPKKKR